MCKVTCTAALLRIYVKYYLRPIISNRAVHQYYYCDCYVRKYYNVIHTDCFAVPKQNTQNTINPDTYIHARNPPDMLVFYT